MCSIHEDLSLVHCLKYFLITLNGFLVALYTWAPTAVSNNSNNKLFSEMTLYEGKQS